MLKERQKSILDAVIREFIRTAKPVASKDVIRELRLDVSAATARNEMLELDKLGYLEQPHTSAGRIPTDRGYRFFVENLISDLHLGRDEEQMIHKLFRLPEEGEFVRELSRLAAVFSGTLVAVGTFEKKIFYESGFSSVLKEPEFSETEEVQRFGKLLDILEEEARSLFNDLNLNREEVFIGDENPIKEARKYAMIVSGWKHPRGFKGFITLTAPKRTNYPRHLALIKVLQRCS